MNLCHFVSPDRARVQNAANDDQTSDWTANGLTAILIAGLYVSYLPQVCLTCLVDTIVAQRDL